MMENFLFELNEVMNCMKDNKDPSIIDLKIHELREIYCSYSYNEKNQIHDMVKNLITLLSSNTLWFLSFLIRIIEPNIVIKLLIELIYNSNFDFFQLSSIETQIAFSQLNVNYDLRREIHRIVIEKSKEFISFDYPYISSDKRDKNTIILFTEQILYIKNYPITHSPTKLILDYCLFLKKQLNKQVYLIVMPSINSISDEEWYHTIEHDFLEMR